MLSIMVFLFFSAISIACGKLEFSRGSWLERGREAYDYFAGGCLACVIGFIFLDDGHGVFAGIGNILPESGSLANGFVTIILFVVFFTLWTASMLYIGWEWGKLGIFNGWTKNDVEQQRRDKNEAW